MTLRLPPTCTLLALSLGAALHAAEVDFNYDIQPIISSKCFQCHGPDEKAREAKLRLDVRDEALKERDGVRAIVPGDLQASELVLRITSTDKDEVMPPPKEGHPLSAREIDLLKRWIAQGAEYKPHWSFIAPKRPTVPAINAAVRGANPIDGFIRVRLEQAGLALSPPADRHTLLRRVTLDLTGLPPSPRELAAFMADDSADAYEKVVDRLLVSSAYGERWAKMWLDLARYADSSGYGSDQFRLNIWPYRDWVINALNRNLPYDQFTIEQLAGDLLPNATPEQIAATGFHRNTMTNVEGGTDDEEYRVAAIKDRVATTGQVWMGLTLGCAQCHSHKFDPISHKEYYQLFAIFNQTEDSDRADEAPRLPLPTPEEKQGRDRIDAELAALEKKIKADSPEFATEQHTWEAEMSKPIDWQPVAVTDLKVDGGAKLEKLADGSIAVTGRSAYADTFTVRADTPISGITALRLELLPQSEAKGQVALSELSVTASGADPKPITGRFLRIELPGDGKILSLAEVEVFSGQENLARNSKVVQSSIAFAGAPERAIDGNTDGDYYKANSVSHTQQERDPWWEIDLGAEKAIDSVILWNRTDHGLAERLKDFRVLILDAMRKPLWQQAVSSPPKPSAAYLSGAGRRWRYANRAPI